MTEVWERDGSLECFSSEDRICSYESKNGHFYARCHGGIRTYSKEMRSVTGRADCPEDPVLAARLDKSSDVFYTAHKSKLIRAWVGANLEPSQEMSAMKTDHRGPIILLAVKGKRLVTASAESVLKVWNISQRHCTGVLRNCAALPICLEYVEFSESEKLVICGTNSGSLHVWNGDTSEIVASATKHFSQVSAVEALVGCSAIISAGRDKTLIIWSTKLEAKKVIPAFEEIECAVGISPGMATKITKLELPDDGDFFVTAGEKSRLRVWSAKKMAEILEPNGSDWPITRKGVLLKDQKIADVFCGGEESMTIVQDDLFSVCKFSAKKNKISGRTVICANQHEILDVIVVNERHLVVATMSPVIKIYDLSNENNLIVGCGGHEDSVLSVAPCPGGEADFVSCGKDHSVSLWTIEEDKVVLKGRGTGHSSFVGAVCASTKHVYSASKDGIIKVWKRPSKEAEEGVAELQTKKTVLAHDQEINDLHMSVNGDLVASASQDKTCKIWNCKDMGLVSTLTGHRRGIWRVRFTDDAVWTASADCSIKKWSLNSYNCLATLEGHLSSVLALAFVDEKRLASVSSDGLLKVWDAKTGNAVGTFDAHEDKVWAVAFSPAKGQIITAGRDGNVYFWADKTEEHNEKERLKAEAALKSEQRLANFVQAGQLAKALKLSLRLDKPRQAKKILLQIQSAGSDALDKAVVSLDVDLKNILLKFSTTWNTIGGASCELAQDVIKILITDYLSADGDAAKHKVDAQQVAGLLAYSDKHYRRLDKLQSRIAVVDLLLAQM